MITELYTFSVGSFVVAEEWNANFRVLYDTNVAHYTALVDAQNVIAFPDSDLSDVFNAVNNQFNSFAIAGNTITVAPQSEYYKTLANGEDLAITIPSGLNSESRILIQIQEDRTLLPFSVSYAGTTIVNYGYYNYDYFTAGYYYIMIHESNGVAQIKLIWTGV